MSTTRSGNELDEQGAIQALRPKLKDYLMVMGVKMRGILFSCINPSHPDNNPSAGIVPHSEGEVFHCFGCKTDGNIFTAAHLLEHLPIQGPEFYNHTLPRLAERFNIKYKKREMNEDEKLRASIMRAYSDASEVIQKFVLRSWEQTPQPEQVAIIKARGITLDSVKAFKIGAIPSIEAYRGAMLSRGWTESFLTDYHLLERPEKTDRIFEPGKIIITICDPNGCPIAFVSRKHAWKGSEDGSKYVNSPTTVIYEKAKTLFGLNLALDSSKGIGQRGKEQKQELHIVEGYIDTITLRQAGLHNVAGLGAAAFQSEIFGILRSNYGVDISNIVLALDGDTTGQEETRKAVGDIISHHPGVKVSVKQLPNIPGYHDPDEVVRRGGLEEYNKLEVFSPFKWTIKEKKDKNIPEAEFVKEQCVFIANEPSPLKRVNMIKELASMLVTYDEGSITEEVALHRDDKKAKMQTELNIIMDDLGRKRVNTRISVVELLNSAAASARHIVNQYTGRSGGPIEAYARAIKETKELFKTNTGATGFKMNTFPRIERALDGFPDRECLIAIAGEPNIGKSTLVREWSWDIAKSNEDAVVIYMSIDDSSRDVLQAIVAREAVEARKFVSKYYLLDPDKNEEQRKKKDAIDEAWEKVRKQENYIVCDANLGTSVLDLQNHIEHVRSSFKGKRPIVFLDNFHKLRSFSDASSAGMREKFIELSQQLKDITQAEDIPIVMTVELRKSDHSYGRKFTLDDIAETKKIQYDAKVIMYIKQDLHEDRNTPVIWTRTDYTDDMGPRVMPYLELDIMKNKHSEVKDRYGYRFHTDRSELVECDWSEIEDRYKAKAQKNKPIQHDGASLWKQPAE